MSDTEPQKPSVTTSTVPLKKETVRISLRAPAKDSGPVAPKSSTGPIPSDGPATDQIESTAPLPPDAPTTAPPSPTPQPAPGAPTPPTPPPAPSGAPVPPAAPTGAKTIPLSKGPDPLGPTKPVGTAPLAAAPSGPDPLEPTAPAAAAPAGASPVGAKTIPLAKGPSGAGPGPVGKATTPLQDGGPKPLPQATVKMGSTQPMGSTGALAKTISQKPNIQSTAEEVEEEWEEEYEESGLMPFAIIALILSLAVLAIQLVVFQIAGGA